MVQNGRQRKMKAHSNLSVCIAHNLYFFISTIQNSMQGGHSKFPWSQDITFMDPLQIRGVHWARPINDFEQWRYIWAFITNPWEHTIFYKIIYSLTTSIIQTKPQQITYLYYRYFLQSNQADIKKDSGLSNTQKWVDNTHLKIGSHRFWPWINLFGSISLFPGWIHHLFHKYDFSMICNKVFNAFACQELTGQCQFVNMSISWLGCTGLTPQREVTE